MKKKQVLTRMSHEKPTALIYFKPLSLKGTNDSEDIVAAYAFCRSNARFLAEENQFSHIQTAAQKIKWSRIDVVL